MSDFWSMLVRLGKGYVISPWVFNVYMDSVVQEVNAWVLWKGLELPSVNGAWFEINHLLFSDDTAVVANSEEKLGRVVSEFGRVCKIRQSRLNVGKSTFKVRK